ncbi:hypothetical protein PsYK624_138530 [Phanerochaete sordida]|uniref:F-box domain-containing protein n=1 Tax=Phanerochaete sordida TaxID=48140 RepID=A0A9P3LKV1_9APHY|nr:hypothetical protein PsYK624_138530 [Phanerochaete sordida]
MHPALQIFDILDNILRCVEERQYKRRAVVALARTCRTFYETASDHLWEDLPRLSYLFEFVPQDLHKKVKLHATCGEQDQARQLCDPVWRRITANAARVKSLTFNCSDCPCLKQHMPMIDLMRTDGSSGIFPNLRTLSVGYSDSCSDKHPTPRQLAVVLNPDIRQLTVSHGPEDEFGGTINISKGILPCIIRSCPLLEVVILNDNPGREGVKMLRSLGSLKRVECTLHGEETAESWDLEYDLIDLAPAPALSDLSINAPWDYADVARDLPRYQPTSFSDLKTLELSQFPFEHTIVSLLEKLDAPLLQKLEINGLAKLRRDGEDHLVRLLGLLQKFLQLRVLKIRGRSVDEPLRLQPSLRLWALEELEINIRSALKVSLISEVAQACPHLRRFAGYWGPYESRAKPWNLRVLEECAANMPHLECISTKFYTENIRELQEPSARSSFPITICVGRSELEERDWEDVAAYIAKIYPNAICQVYSTLKWDDIPDNKLYADDVRWRSVSRAVAEAGSLESSGAHGESI